MPMGVDDCAVEDASEPAADGAGEVDAGDAGRGDSRARLEGWEGAWTTATGTAVGWAGLGRGGASRTGACWGGWDGRGAVGAWKGAAEPSDDAGDWWADEADAGREEEGEWRAPPSSRAAPGAEGGGRGPRGGRLAASCMRGMEALRLEPETRAAAG